MLGDWSGGKHQLVIVGRQGFDSGRHPWSGLVLLFPIIQAVLMTLTLGGEGGMGASPPCQISGEGP